VPNGIAVAQSGNLVAFHPSHLSYLSHSSHAYLGVRSILGVEC
jgi:hypothetical protein